MKKSIIRLGESAECGTYKAVGELVGVDPGNFKSYPSVKRLIEQNVELILLDEKSLEQKESDLVERVKSTIDHLESLDQKVTQYSISRISGVNRTILQKYPRVVALLEENTKRQRLRREEILLMKVKGVVQELQENQERVTLKAIGEKMNINPANYYHYTKIITFLREVVEKDKNRVIQENFSSREEELVCQVSDVIQAMQLHMQPISLHAMLYRLLCTNDEL